MENRSRFRTGCAQIGGCADNLIFRKRLTERFFIAQTVLDDDNGGVSADRVGAESRLVQTVCHLETDKQVVRLEVRFYACFEDTGAEKEIAKLFGKDPVTAPCACSFVVRACGDGDLRFVSEA